MPTHEFACFTDNWRDEWRKMIAADQEGMSDSGRAAHQLYGNMVEAMLEYLMAQRHSESPPEIANTIGLAAGQAFFTGLTFVAGPLHVVPAAELAMSAFVHTFTQNLATAAAEPTGKPN